MKISRQTYRITLTVVLIVMVATALVIGFVHVSERTTQSTNNSVTEENRLEIPVMPIAFTRSSTERVETPRT